MAKNDQNQPQGPSQRQLRVGELIRRAVADILMRGDIHDPDLAHVSITVGEVRPTPDLKTALVFVLPLGGENASAVIDALNRNTYEVRRAMNKSVALKFSPKLKFVLDTTFDNLDETRRLLSLDQVVQDISTED
ncbi:30S ribosome-binding factor RbfA [Amylibacter marinus]|nr:30S ribosome-binding factor RbfA [Amylibacter marinus]